MKYEVLVDDNSHYMDEGARHSAGAFPSAEEAIAAAKKIVDASLHSLYKPGMKHDELYDA